MRNEERRLFPVKCVNGQWSFPYRSWLSTEWTVFRWTYVNDGE
ncbi:MAG: hypothetical protein R2811_16265 [Flavobacteriales bacterium]